MVAVQGHHPCNPVPTLQSLLGTVLAPCACEAVIQRVSRVSCFQACPLQHCIIEAFYAPCKMVILLDVSDKAATEQIHVACSLIAFKTTMCSLWLVVAPSKLASTSYDLEQHDTIRPVATRCPLSRSPQLCHEQIGHAHDAVSNQLLAPSPPSITSI